MKYFLDTSYLIAITHKQDQYHEKAAAVSKKLEKPVRLVTTSAVLMEFGNMLSSVRLRSKAF
ncbi:MAG: PIN domain-containing protein, partial [Candidatus Electrothrix sp. MAN1_4]|nr:PIN domain-containing protein [Candidatus Electrothrix sp. MAN1_4]